MSPLLRHLTQVHRRFSIRLATSKQDREEIYRLRYEVYVAEMCLGQHFADHERRRIEEPLDRTAYVWGIWDSSKGRLAGTSRANCLWEPGSDAGAYVNLLRLRDFGPGYPDGVCLRTKFIMAPEYRCGVASMLLLKHVFSELQGIGVIFDVTDVRAKDLAWVGRYGYRQYLAPFRHPETQDWHFPCALALKDWERIAATPFRHLVPAQQEWDPSVAILDELVARFEGCETLAQCIP